MTLPSAHENEQGTAGFRLWFPFALSHLGFKEDFARQIALARVIVARYVRSGWFVGEMASIAGLFVLCFGGTFDVAYFYRIAGLALALFAIIATYLLDHEMAPPHTYLLRSLHSLGRPTVAPLVLAAALTRIISVALLLALVLIFQRLALVGPLLAGAVGLLANCILIAAVTVVLSSPYTRRIAQLGILAWLVTGLAAYYPGTIFSYIPVVSWVLRLPLLPFAVCYDVGVTGTIDWLGVVALAAEAGMIAAAIALADARLRIRLGRRWPRL